MRKPIWLMIAVFTTLAIAGCGGGDGGGGSSTTPANLSGTWKGKATSSISGTFVNITLTITQTGSDISGTLTCSTGDVSCLHSTASISGTIVGSNLTTGVVWSDNHSCGTFDASVSGNTMSGQYSCSDPLGDDEGSWNVTRQ